MKISIFRNLHLPSAGVTENILSTDFPGGSALSSSWLQSFVRKMIAKKKEFSEILNIFLQIPEKKVKSI